MSKMRKPPSQRQPKGYDIEMIRDFLAHLMWHLRIQIHESQTGPDAPVNPELVEQLKFYIRKRGTVSLIFNHAFSQKPTREEELEFRRTLATLRKCQLQCLESLQHLFDEAFDAASRPGSMSTIGFKDAARGIEAMKEYQRKHDSGGTWQDDDE
jgi:hypothetical protein